MDGRKLNIQEPSDTSGFVLIGYAIFVTGSNYMPTAWAVKYSNPIYFGAENTSNWRLLEIFQFPKLTCKMNILFMIKDKKIYIKRKQILLALITYKHYNNILKKKEKQKDFNPLTG